MIDISILRLMTDFREILKASERSGACPKFRESPRQSGRVDRSGLHVIINRPLCTVYICGTEIPGADPGGRLGFSSYQLHEPPTPFLKSCIHPWVQGLGNSHPTLTEVPSYFQ